MACLRPLEVDNNKGGKSLVPCRHCIGCTIKKIQELKVYAQAEYAQNALNNRCSSFIRLSYNDANLPVIFHGELKRLGELVVNGNVPVDFQPTLLKSDFVRFMKRLRQNLNRFYDGRKIKYIYCGEYGTQNTERSHYHLILFGLSYLEAKEVIDSTWTYGFCDYKPLKTGAVSYIAKYMFNDVFGELKEKKYTSKGIEPPFLYHSSNLGLNYIMKYEEHGTILLNGKRYALPSYLKSRYNLKSSPVSSDTVKQFTSESINKAFEYVSSSRQMGVPVDDSSLKYTKFLNEEKQFFNYERFIHGD